MLSPTLDELQTLVINALEDVKAYDIQIFDTTAKTSLFERVILATGASNRQTRALVKSVIDAVRARHVDIVALEGEQTGEWVLLDLGNIVLHCMQPAIRAYYDLESLWGGKSVEVPLLPQSRQKAPVAPQYGAYGADNTSH